jgi:gliding motility-associated-like protein
MRTSLTRLSSLAAVLLCTALNAQQLVLPEAAYQQAKAGGILAEGAIPAMGPIPDGVEPVAAMGARGGGEPSDCNCWIQPDNTYTLAMAPNDDGSSPAIALPFQFDLYGDLYSTVYINNNGNVSFQQPFGTFSSTGFPSNNYRMVAPFWADVDTRPVNGGQVWYKITPTAMYVNWVAVGYYNMQTDKLNSFQLIITNGNDPVIGSGKNVSFCYLDMQWTTGSASGGSGGFGGTAATVGANRGSNGDFIQFGRFNQAGTAYDGPFGANDGVSWLDNKNFVFTTQTNTQNVPPVATGLYICDTLYACVGQQAQLEVTFLSPESGQTTVANSSAPTLGSWVEIANLSGITASITGEFTPGVDDVGFHQVTFNATDNGVPNLTTTVDIVIQVIPPPSEPPMITGASAICTGQSTVLTAGGGFSNYVWSNGQTGPSITITQPGTYTVTAGVGLCQLISPPFSVALVTPPPIAITGPGTYCGTPLPTLTASAGYDSYSWSNGQAGQSVPASAGTITVTGNYLGCLNTSAPFTLTLIDPGPPVITGPAVYCEGGNATLSVNVAGYDSFSWNTGATSTSITVTQGSYTVNASYDNCTYTSTPFQLTEIVLPPLLVIGDTVQCGGLLLNISASPGFESYAWNNGSTGPTISVGSGTYFVTAYIGPCYTSSLLHTIIPGPIPAPVITGPNFSCEGQPLQLSTSQPFSSYLWSTGAQSPGVSVGSGSYTVTVTNAFGCTGTSAPFTVLVVNNPVAGIGTDPVSPQLPNTEVLFSDASDPQGGTIQSWTWIMDDGAMGSGPEVPWTFTAPGTYAITLVVTTTNGCTDSLTVQYVIVPADIFVTNVFSPNGDGVNDTFWVENIEYFSNELTIMNRWGMPVYTTRNYRNAWRANDVPDGTYYYILRLDGGREYTGHVTILR